MKRVLLLLACVCAALAGGVAAHADVLKEIFSGSVGSIVGSNSGLIEGEPFVATFTIDTAQGYYENFGGGDNYFVYYSGPFSVDFYTESSNIAFYGPPGLYDHVKGPSGEFVEEFRNAELGSDVYQIAVSYDLQSFASGYQYDRSSGFIDGPGFEAQLNVATPAPEPSSWALMIAGLGIVSFVLRHCRRVLNPLQRCRVMGGSDTQPC